jgi:hypothetical protein
VLLAAERGCVAPPKIRKFEGESWPVGLLVLVCVGFLTNHPRWVKGGVLLLTAEKAKADKEYEAETDKEGGVGAWLRQVTDLNLFSVRGIDECQIMNWDGSYSRQGVETEIQNVVK